MEAAAASPSKSRRPAWRPHCFLHPARRGPAQPGFGVWPGAEGACRASGRGGASAEAEVLRRPEWGTAQAPGATCQRCSEAEAVPRGSGGEWRRAAAERGAGGGGEGGGGLLRAVGRGAGGRRGARPPGSRGSSGVLGARGGGGAGTGRAAGGLEPRSRDWRSGEPGAPGGARRDPGQAAKGAATSA